MIVELSFERDDRSTAASYTERNCIIRETETETDRETETETERCRSNSLKGSI